MWIWTVRENKGRNCFRIHTWVLWIKLHGLAPAGRSHHRILHCIRYILTPCSWFSIHFQWLGQWIGEWMNEHPIHIFISLWWKPSNLRILQFWTEIWTFLDSSDHSNPLSILGQHLSMIETIGPRFILRETHSSLFLTQLGLVVA